MERALIENTFPVTKATVAVARELSCFVWGMMNGRISLPPRRNDCANACILLKYALSIEFSISNKFSGSGW